MLYPRIIPCLLIQDGGLVKTQKFKNPKYVGDPLNAVRIFNEKEVDELMVIDISASSKGNAPDEKLIANIASECRMPLCYGGGVKSVEQFEKLVQLGVEKVAISSAAVENPDLVSNAAERVGSQSVVVVLDVKYTGIFKRREIMLFNGSKRTGIEPLEFAKNMQDRGAGEIVVNSVDRDGTMQGYDLELISAVKEKINLPLTVIGGAGSLADIRDLTRVHPIIGAAAGSIFVFKGKYRAVLIQYFSTEEKKSILHNN